VPRGGVDERDLGGGQQLLQLLLVESGEVRLLRSEVDGEVEVAGEGLHAVSLRTSMV